jgi:type VI secretion system protein ImpF
LPSRLARDRLQPSLFDRLEDELGSAVTRLREVMQVLYPSLNEAQRSALDTLLNDERISARLPSYAQLASFADLDDDLRALVNEALRLEQIRRIERERVFTISMERLRRAVLDDLQNLFDATNAETGDPDEGDAMEATPTVRDSVLNYGLPPLAGRLGTPDLILQVAQDIERAIARFEPRVRNARVSLEEANQIGEGERIGFIIEGELWGYPYDEQLRIHTVLDLDVARVRLAQTGEAAGP